MKLRVKIDKYKCIGCGTCAALAFDVFSLDQEGCAIVNDQFKSIEISDPQIIEKIKMTLNACPSGAIIIEEF